MSAIPFAIPQAGNNNVSIPTDTINAMTEAVQQFDKLRVLFRFIANQSSGDVRALAESGSELADIWGNVLDGEVSDLGK